MFEKPSVWKLQKREKLLNSHFEWVPHLMHYEVLKQCWWSKELYAFSPYGPNWYSQYKYLTSIFKKFKWLYVVFSVRVTCGILAIGKKFLKSDGWDNL